MSSIHTKAARVAESILTQAREAHREAVHAKFAPALEEIERTGAAPKRTRGKITIAPRKLLEQARKAAFDAGLPAAEEAALQAFVARAPAVSNSVLDTRLLPRYKLNAAGERLADDATDGHVITHFPTVGLMIDVREPREVSSLKEASEHAASVELLGRTGEWIVGQDYETQLIIDRAFHEPAVNPSWFPNMLSSGRVYTRTPTAWSSAHVWYVSLNYGFVGWFSDDNHGLVVPVLRVPVSQ